MRRPDHHRIAQRRIFAQRLVAQNRPFDFFRADAVPGHVDHVVRAAVQGERAVGVAPRVVALGVRQTLAPALEVRGAKALEVAAPLGLAQALGVAPDRARQIRVGPGDDQLPFLAVGGDAPRGGAAALVAVGGYAHFGLNPRQRPGLGVGLQVLEIAPGAGEHHAAVFRGPVGIDVALAEVLHGELLHGRRHRFGAERGHFQAAQVVAGQVAHARRVAHHRFEEGRAGFEDRRPVALND